MEEGAPGNEELFHCLSSDIHSDTEPTWGRFQAFAHVPLEATAETREMSCVLELTAFHSDKMLYSQQELFTSLLRNCYGTPCS